MQDLIPNYRGAVFVVPEHPWPSTSGARIRAAGIATALRELGPLTVLALDSTEADPGWLAAVRRHRGRRESPRLRARDIAAGLARGRHVVLERAERAGLPSALGAVLGERRPSVVVLARPLWGGFFEAARESGAAVIAEADESQWKVGRSVLRSSAPIQKRGRAFLDILSAARMERSELRRMDQIWVSSDAEVRPVRSDAGNVPIVVVPNAAGLPTQPPASSPKLNAVGFVGYYAHPPNEAAALELIGSVMPAIRAAGGPRRLMLIGREPTERMYRAARVDPEVTITGAVADPSSALREAGVLVMPVRSGGGTRVKALEAAGAAVPIVSTAYGVEGLPFRPGQDVLIAETPMDFATALQELADPVKRAALAHSAYERVAQFNSHEAQQQAIVAAISQLLAPTSEAASSETTASGR